MTTEPFTTEQQFLDAVEVLPSSEADAIRNSFVNRFVNTEGEYFRQQIAALKDGFYFGYLWDAFEDPLQIPVGELWRRVSGADQLLVMWDNHAQDRVWVAEGAYFRFPARTVFSLDQATLARGIDLLPEDLYIFDQRLKWTAVLTHEQGADGEHYCLWAGDSPRKEDLDA